MGDVFRSLWSSEVPMCKHGDEEFLNGSSV